jgi:hypothetical protein
MAGSDRPDRPMLRGLLEVPDWRERYLAHVRSMAQALAWDRLGPEVRRLHALIADVVHGDSRKLYDDDAFDASVAALEETSTARQRAVMSHETMTGRWPAIASVGLDERSAEGGSTLAIQVRTGGEAPVSRVWLHWQLKRPGPFTALEMERDEEGLFSARIPVQKEGEKIHYYIEALSEGDVNRRAYDPPGAASAAIRFTFGK